MALPQTAVAALKAAIAKYDAEVAGIKAEIARLKLIGVDTSTYQASIVNLENQVRQIKQQYATELA